MLQNAVYYLLYLHTLCRQCERPHRHGYLLVTAGQGQCYMRIVRSMINHLPSSSKTTYLFLLAGFHVPKLLPVIPQVNSSWVVTTLWKYSTQHLMTQSLSVLIGYPCEEFPILGRPERYLYSSWIFLTELCVGKPHSKEVEDFSVSLVFFQNGF